MFLTDTYARRPNTGMHNKTGVENRLINVATKYQCGYNVESLRVPEGLFQRIDSFYLEYVLNNGSIFNYFNLRPMQSIF